MNNKFFVVNDGEGRAEGLDFSSICAFTYDSPHKEKGEEETEAELTVNLYSGDEYEYHGVIATQFYMALQDVQLKEEK